MPLKKMILYLFPLLCLPLAAIALDSPGPPLRPGKDCALFFANDDYRSHPDFGNLNNPVKDARAIARELKEMYGFEEARVYENYSRNQIYQVLQQWQKRRFAEDGQLFIFFSGHGDFWEFTQKGYFVPKTNASDYSAYIELTDLGNIITQIPCRHILLAVDACYSGAIDQEIVFKGREFSRPNDTPTTERDNIVYRQLRNQSRLLITSGGKQRTPDGKNHSPFAGAILAGLRAAYTHGDGLFTFTDLLGRLERVSPTPHQGELPQHEQGGFVFVTSTAVSTPPAPGRPATSRPSVKPPDNMVFIQGGSFEMGDSFGDGSDDEKPVHTVTVGDFYLAIHETTFDEYDAFCEATGREKPDDKGWGRGRRPAIYVSWNDAVAYCNWLSEQHGYQKVYTISGSTVTANWNANGYRLPTEAEWEFAARSRGKKEKWAGTSTESALASYANYSEKGGKDGYEYTAPVGSLRANSAGLHDMSGNVWEWCWDWYDSGYYEKSKSSRNPRGPDSGSRRVRRGGSWNNYPAYARCAFRGDFTPDFRYSDLGFRLARPVE